MKIVIISDIHDNLVNLNKVIKWSQINNINQLICCGDVTNSDTLKFINYSFFKNIYLVSGNCKLFEDKEIKDLKNIFYYDKIGRFEIDGKKIGICHEPIYIKEVLKIGKCDIIFYGHTHQPWKDIKFNTLVVNPGTLGGGATISTFAIYNTKTNEIELKITQELDLHL